MKSLFWSLSWQNGLAYFVFFVDDKDVYIVYLDLEKMFAISVTAGNLYFEI